MASSMLFLLALSISSAVGDLETAPYTVLTEHAGWEEREFPASKWISTDVFTINVHDSIESSKAFFRLFNYIDGQNSEGMKIAMTAPVSNRIIAGEGPNCESNFTMSFYIPSDLQENPPLPLDASVYIEERAGFQVASKRFGGFPNNDIEFTIQAAELYELAVAEGLGVAAVPLWTAVYDGPNVITNRRNEVWLEIN